MSGAEDGVVDRDQIMLREIAHWLRREPSIRPPRASGRLLVYGALDDAGEERPGLPAPSRAAPIHAVAEPVRSP